LNLGFTAVTPAGLASLAASPQAERLTRLEVMGLSLRGEGAAAMTGLLEHCPLRSLEISDGYDAATTQPDAEAPLVAFDALLAARNWTGPLRELKVFGVSPDLGRWRSFFASPLFAGLSSLDFVDAGLPPGTIEALAESPHLAGLRSFSLEPRHGRALGRAEIELLAGAPALEGVRSLSLTHLSCDDDVLSDLVRSPRLRHLRRLQL